MKLITYYYYANKENIDGKNKLSGRVEDTFNFDTNKYRDNEDNYLNVLSDFLQEKGIDYHRLTIVKVSNK